MICGNGKMICFKNVSQNYGNEQYGVRNIDLTINDGEFVFITGPNGSGKTTLAKLITNEQPVDSGKLTVNGYELHSIKKSDVPYLRRSMGIVFQDFRLFEHKTVYENIAFAMRVTGAHPKKIRTRVPSIISAVGLDGKERNFPSELSGGEQQRVAFARAIVNNPKLIIADEPTGNIDKEMSYEIMELLSAMNNLKKTVVVISHDDELVHKYAKRVIRMEDGRIVSDTVSGGDAE